MSMSTQARISELKQRLSYYLNRVRRGESIVVLDRDRVIARIDPAGGPADGPTGEAGWLDDLERRGVVRRAPARLSRDWLARRPKARADVLEALLSERDESR
jgi:antitoxin (DNA-binding transcriptional repressor) of toxin-antitoxin stability system